MWLSKIKSALATEDIDTIEHLINEMPQFENLNQMQEAYYILVNIKNMVEKNKVALSIQLQQLKNSIDFLESTTSPQQHTLNIKL